jgi:hypothetical protein
VRAQEIGVGKVIIRRLLPAWFLLVAVGCKTWEPAPTTLESLIAEAPPPSVRVTTADGSRVTLRNPLVVNDSIVSAVAPPPGAVVVPPRAGVAERDVNFVEVPRLSVGRTVALGAAIAGASILWATVQGAGGGGEPRPDPLPKDPMLRLLGIFTFSLSFR